MKSLLANKVTLLAETSSALELEELAGGRFMNVAQRS
jgi:hypothetical protein